MDSQTHDRQFVTTFLIVLGCLGAFTVVISIIAGVLSARHDDGGLKAARVEQRMKPAGEVFTDAAALLAATPAPAARAPLSGEEVVAKVCGACHNAGVLGAPKNGAPLRARGPLATLVSNAIKGKGAMPARGGDPSLTDDEIKAAVQVMLK